MYSSIQTASFKSDSVYVPTLCPATCVCVWEKNWLLMHGWMLCVSVCVLVIILCVYISHGHMKKHKEHLHRLCVCACWQKDSSLHFFKASLFSVEPGLWTKKNLKGRGWTEGLKLVRSWKKSVFNQSGSNKIKSILVIRKLWHKLH